MSDPPQIQIPTPTSLTSTSTSLPPETSQSLIAHLRATGQISDLSDILADSLARTGWTDRVRALSLELLRNGTCDTFPELLTEVLRRAKIPKSNTSAASSNSNINSKTNGTSTSTATNGATTGGGVTGNNAIALSKEWSGGPDGLPDVRIPETTVEMGVNFLKGKIKDVVEPIQDESD